MCILFPFVRLSFIPGCETPFDISSRSEHEINCLHRRKERKPRSFFPWNVLSLLSSPPPQALSGTWEVQAIVAQPSSIRKGQIRCPWVSATTTLVPSLQLRPTPLSCSLSLIRARGNFFTPLVSPRDKEKRPQPISEPHIQRSDIMSCILLRALQVPQIFLKCDCL